jgi:hypothetical protein
VQIDQEEEETSSYHSCEGSLLVVPSLLFLPQPFQGSSIGDNNLLVTCGILKVLLVGGAADGCGGPDPNGCGYRDGNRGGDAEGDQGVSRDRGLHGYAFLGEHWGNTHLGEHWGPARERYLRGPWVPHPEELDRYVRSFCFHSQVNFPLCSLSSPTVHSAH